MTKVELNVAIQTKDGVRTLKELKGSIQDVRDQIKSFNVGTISKQFKDISKVVDILNAKLDKFGQHLNGKQLSAIFQNQGGTTNLVGSSIRGSGGNQISDSGQKLVTVFNQLEKAVSNLMRTMNAANMNVSRAAVGAGGGGSGFIGGGGRSSGGGGLGDAAGQLFGGLGFGLIDAATQIRSIFQDKRVKNAFSDSASKLFGLLGSIFGDSVASIAGDIGKAFGEIGEIAFNLLTLKFRLLGLTLAAAVKGIGVALGLSLFGGFSLLTGGLGFIVAGSLAVLSGLFGATSSLIKELVSDLLDTLESLFKAAFSVITATIKTVITVFESVAKIVKSVWEGLWEGLKGIAKASIEGVKQAVSTIGSSFVDLSNKALKDFISLQKGVVKGNKEIVDSAGRLEDEFSNVIRNVSSEFGNTNQDIADLFFSSASRGILRRSGRNAAKDFATFSNAVADSAESDAASIANVGNATISVLENYGLAMSETERVTDLLNRTTTLGATDMNELSVALANVLPTAAALNFGLEDTLASVARITQVLGPGKAKSATTQFSRLLEGLAIPTDASRKALEKLGVSFTGVFEKSGKFKKGGFNSLLSQVARLRKELGSASDSTFREIFPLKQARTSFLALTSDLKELASVRRNIETISIGGQKAFIRTTVFSQLSRLSASLRNISEKVLGEFQGKLVQSALLTEKIVKAFNKIQRFTTSKQFGSGFSKLQKVFGSVFTDTEGSIIRLANRLGTVIQSLTGGGFEGVLTRFGILINDMVTGLINLFLEIVTVDNIISVFDRLVGFVEHLRDQLPLVKTLLKSIFSGNFKLAVSTTGDIFQSIFGFSASDVAARIISVIGNALEVAVGGSAMFLSDLIDGFSFGFINQITGSTLFKTFTDAGTLIAVSFGIKFLDIIQGLIPFVQRVANALFNQDIFLDIVNNAIAAGNALSAVFKVGLFFLDTLPSAIKEGFNSIFFLFNQFMVVFKEAIGELLFFSDERIEKFIQPNLEEMNRLSSGDQINAENLQESFNKFLNKINPILGTTRENLSNVQAGVKTDVSDGLIKSQEQLRSSMDTLKTTIKESFGEATGQNSSVKLTLEQLLNLPSNSSLLDANNIELVN